jgi:hypothetical protein
MRYAFLILILAAVCAVPTALTQVEAEDAESKPRPTSESRNSSRHSPSAVTLPQEPANRADGTGTVPATLNSRTRSKQKPAAKEKPLLLLHDEPPLMLDDAAGAGGADNSRCQVCHLNLAMEELAVTHAKEDIGCADCHGDCDAHIDDESWASGGPGTPPEIMYPPERIDGACGECHDTHDAPAKKVLERWQLRCPEKTVASSIVCTDCHGKHRLNPKLRKAWWDKKTGKPIKSEGGRRTEGVTD